MRQHDCWEPAPLTVAMLPPLGTTSLGCSRQCRDAELQLRTLRGNVEKPESRSSLLPPRTPLAPLLSLLALEPRRTRTCRRASGTVAARDGTRWPSERDRACPVADAVREWTGEGELPGRPGRPWAMGCLVKCRNVVCSDRVPVATAADLGWKLVSVARTWGGLG